MADPRSNFNRPTFRLKNCNVNQSSLISNTERKDFFDGLVDIGNLEILNDIGFGKVGEGLRALSTLSDSIRLGDTTVPSGVSDATGDSWVLDQIGISKSASEELNKFYPQVANRAWGQAKAIYEKVKQGEFTLSDIPETFSDLQNLAILIDGIYVDKTPEQREFALCGASPYARDLIAFAPKYKFLFVVQIQFTEPFIDGWGQRADGLSLADGLSFVIKNSTRPNVTFDYEEVNMYNFWTRIPKRTVYEPMTMRFYDDNKNFAHKFYTAYMRAVSPISNLPPLPAEAYQALSITTDDNDIIPGTGIIQGNTFGDDAPTLANSAASRGPLAGNQTTVIKTIKLFHVFDYGKRMNVYNFANPKMLALSPDELDMADNGNGSEMEIQFAYDAMHVETDYDLSDTSIYNISQLTNQGQNYDLSPLHTKTNTETIPNSHQQAEQSTVIRLDTIPGISESLINSTTGLISNAFEATSNFAGSLFTNVSTGVNNITNKFNSGPFDG